MQKLFQTKFFKILTPIKILNSELDHIVVATCKSV